MHMLMRIVSTHQYIQNRLTTGRRLRRPLWRVNHSTTTSTVNHHFDASQSQIGMVQCVFKERAMRQVLENIQTYLPHHYSPVVQTVVLRWRYAGPWRAARGRMAAPAAA
jgi:protoporphyrinogen oxidase